MRNFYWQASTNDLCSTHLVNLKMITICLHVHLDLIEKSQSSKLQLQHEYVKTVNNIKLKFYKSQPVLPVCSVSTAQLNLRQLWVGSASQLLHQSFLKSMHRNHVYIKTVRKVELKFYKSQPMHPICSVPTAQLNLRQLQVGSASQLVLILLQFLSSCQPTSH